jgi:hypothetical protein
VQHVWWQGAVHGCLGMFEQMGYSLTGLSSSSAMGASHSGHCFSVAFSLSHVIQHSEQQMCPHDDE